MGTFGKMSDEELLRQMKELQEYAKAEAARKSSLKATTSNSSLGSINTAGMSASQAYTAGIQYGNQIVNGNGLTYAPQSNTYGTVPQSQSLKNTRTKEARSVSACIRQINNLLHTIKAMKGQPIEQG